MSILKIVLYILAIPVVVFLHLFFNYFSFISILLILSIALFKDLRTFHLWWFVAISTILVDIALHYWLGTYLLSLAICLLLLKLFERYVDNLFLDIVGVFFGFIAFSFFIQAFLSLQESFSFGFLNFSFFLNSLVFAFLNILLYLCVKGLLYILQSYFREDGFKVR
jgi:hypothetical protein